MKAFKDFEIVVQRREFGRFFDILPIRELSDGTTEIMYSGENGMWTVQHLQEGETIPENKLLRIPSLWIRPLAEALQEYYVPKGPTATEQELKATKFHLEDMRSLVFEHTVKPLPPISEVVI